MIDYLEKQHQQQKQQQTPHQVQMSGQEMGAPPSASQLIQIQYPQQVALHQSTARAQQQQQQILVDVQQPQQSANNELIGYYFGSISRETAEWILKTHGNQIDGAYLLRSSGPNDDFVLSLMVVRAGAQHALQTNQQQQHPVPFNIEVLHYKIVETEDSFVALHGQVGDEKFATIDELIDKAQGVATKPRWPIQRQSLESQILPPTYWGLTVDQVRLAILIKAKQWGFPLFSSLFQQPASTQVDQAGCVVNQQNSTILPNSATVANGFQIDIANNPQSNNNLANNVTTLNNETIRTLIYKSLHEFQPWFHGQISREEAERRIEEGAPRDGRFLVRERDNYSYAMCISHKRTTKHYRIDVLPTGELAIQDGRKFTSLMALVSHYTIMSDGLWCALTEACPRPIQVKQRPNNGLNNNNLMPLNGTINANNNAQINRLKTLNHLNPLMNQNNNLYCVPPVNSYINNNNNKYNSMMMPPPVSNMIPKENGFVDQSQHTDVNTSNQKNGANSIANSKQPLGLVCSNQGAVTPIKAPIKEWLNTINHKWSQLISSKNQHQSLNSFLFGSSNPLNNHCRHSHRNHHHLRDHHHRRRKCKDGQSSCSTCLHNQMNIPTNTALPFDGYNNQVNGSNQLQSTKFNKHQENVLKKVSCNCCLATMKTNPQLATIPFMIDQMNGCPKPGNLFLQRPPPSSNGNNALGDQLDISTSTSTNVLLSCLPQNSGFTLNSQSFIGSPLFAVKTSPQAADTATNLIGGGFRNLGGGGSSGDSTNSGNSGNNNNVGEEKLISPAQSILGNLNSNPYNLGTDIYRSAASTAIVNDQMLTSSSSSSGNQMVNLNHVSLNSSAQLVYGETSKFINNTNNGGQPNNKVPAQLPPPRPQPQQLINGPFQQAGQILCGQHAGPAYRYTNCTGNENFSSCIHSRPLATHRAADDSQLLTPSTQLTGPAALAKFVQFQDGQCLRTHRDTRSIQMAYLSSRLAPNGANLQRNNNQVLLSHQQNFENIGQSHANNKVCDNGSALSYPSISCTNTNGGHVGSNSSNQQHPMTRSRNRNPTGRPFAANTISQSQGTNDNREIDLMDCEADGFDFKYDPKMIKSSSIETLCGAVDEEETIDNLANYKTNSELVISLQSCWQNNNDNRRDDILNPIPASVYQYQQQQEQNNEEKLEQDRDSLPQDGNDNELDRGCILSSLMADATTSDQIEQFDSMKKKHDLDELTTALLAELTASLKAQVDLKNKRSGFGTTLHKSTKQQSSDYSQQDPDGREHGGGTELRQGNIETNPRELVNEFDTLIPNNR